MNPSYNGSFGSGNPGGQVPGGINSGGFGSVPQGRPISSGTGDIILNAGGEQNKSKKLLVVVVVGVVVVVLALVGLLMMNGGIFNKSQDQIYEDFNNSIGEDSENATSMLIFFKGVYEGVVPVASFVAQGDEEYEETKNSLESGIKALNNINSLVQNGKPLEGVSKGFDLGEDYQGLKETLPTNISKYEKLISFTVAIINYSHNQNEENTTAINEYNTSELVETVKNYFNSRKEVANNYSQNGCKENANSEVCSQIITERERINNSLKNTEIVKRSYEAIENDLKYDGEGSVLYYLNNLYAGTRIDDEE